MAARQACSSGPWELPLLVLSTMLRSGPEPDAASFGVCANALAKAVQWRMALHLLPERPNVVVYGATVAACERAGQWEAALSLIGHMRGRGRACLDPGRGVKGPSVLEKGHNRLLRC